LTIASLSVAGATAVPSSGTAVPTSADAAPVAAAPSSAPYELVNGVTAPIHSYEDAIRETVWVLAPDFDRDGTADRIAVDIIRPADLDPDIEIPVIMDASPYYLCCGRGNEAETKRYDADGDPVDFPLFYDNYFVPRGYAVALVDMAGTGRSTGCVDHGGLSDIGSAEAVVRWLDGRTRAVDADGNPASAIWSSGKVGMIGKSYDGTLANGVAAHGVDGLETIVPISAISSWYYYNRYQGLPISRGYASWLSGYVAGERTERVNCDAIFDQLDVDADDDSGVYNAFFRERDYRYGRPFDASEVEASVFIMHGLQDTNVKTPNFSRWWTALGEAGVGRKMWLTRLGHVDAFDSDRAAWYRVRRLATGIAVLTWVSASGCTVRSVRTDVRSTVSLRPAVIGALLGRAGDVRSVPCVADPAAYVTSTLT